MLQLKKITNVPETLLPGAIEEAVGQFVQESRDKNVTLNEDGFYNQTLSNIASIVVTHTNPNALFWLAEEDGKVKAFALTHTSFDVDGSLCFWGTCAWVSKEYRHTKYPKLWFNTLREEAKRLMCKYFIVVSSRGERGYCRFLGKGWHKYVSLLKEDF